MAEDTETFTLLPIALDPTSKAITTTSSSLSLSTELASLNALHRSLLTLTTPHQVPPPPVPINPKRSAQITKMRENANAQLRRATPKDVAPAREAIRLYTFALDMALGRPAWEPAALVREEVAALYANRAQAYLNVGLWVEARGDAEASVVCKRVGNVKAWWRWGRALVEMGLWEEAGRVVGEGIEAEGGAEVDRELGLLRDEVEKKLRAGV
ncbi:MAG: hypothetical protein M1819_005415 [Sarea resinae]|nr:MAG: hypothetical protein M1819_005415 [Sarea resinae]